VTEPLSYAAAGVDVEAGERAVALMRASVARATRPEVVGGIGGFAGLFDASALAQYRRPLLATATDGVGTKVAVARAMDRHDTIGQDLVAMVVDDLVVTGAEPLFLTDYIACGHVVPERIAAIVSGIAEACRIAGCALLGGETAEHPGLMAADEYDLAAAGTAVVEADALLGPHRVAEGDALLAMASSGLHSNGFSLARRVLLDEEGPGIDASPAVLGRPGRNCSSRPGSTLRTASPWRAPGCPCAPSATSPAADSRPTSLGCCRRALPLTSTAPRGRRSRSSR
jgi:phosphoribosylformylglycinamidine cyclo-ligase